MRKLPTVLLLLATLVVGIALAWSFLAREDYGLPDGIEPFSLQGRPQPGRFLFDYAGALRHYEEGAHRYLERLGSRFHIEALIVSVPALPPGQSLETLAVDLANNWRIGSDHEGRGLLLLLVDRTKQVKLEVGYALEDVFTDAFSGYVEDQQLGPYYRAGDVGTGLIAVMEMLEERAQIKRQWDYTPALIAQTDAELLAGGAGAKRNLADYPRPAPAGVAAVAGRGARSPEVAWEVMLQKWAGEGADIDLDVYTEMTRAAMGDANRPDSRTMTWLDHWRNANYQVLRKGNHAVIWFGAVDGWENSPFLFCDTGDGWRFDIVWQRRLVVMAENPKWKVMQGPFPYVGLMGKAWQSTGKDLPLSADDLYQCTQDAAIAARMADLKRVLAANPEDAEATIELMRLNVITDQRPQIVHPLISQAKRLAPDRAEPYKYSAIYNVNSVFQYHTALRETEQYIERRPKDPFGHDMKGFMLYRLGKYQDSIGALEHAVALDPDDGYAHLLMARNYTMLARKATALTRRHYLDRVLAMHQKAIHVKSPDVHRLTWLDTWLRRMLPKAADDA